MNAPAASTPYTDVREMIAQVTRLCAEAAETVAADLGQSTDAEHRSRCIGDLDKMARAVRAGGLALARLDFEARRNVLDQRRDATAAEQDRSRAAESHREARVRAQMARLPWPDSEDRLAALEAFDDHVSLGDLTFDDVVRIVCEEAGLEPPDIPDALRAAAEAALRGEPDVRPAAEVIALRPAPDSS